MSFQANHYQSADVLLINRQTITVLANVLFITILPFTSLAAEHHFRNVSLSPALAGKWFIFWSVSARFLATGFMQVMRSGRGGSTILLQGGKAGHFGRSIGLVKILLAVLSFTCIMKSNFSLLAAVTAGIYIGLVGFQHDFKRPSTTMGWFNLVYDMILVAVITGYFVF